MGTLSTLAVVGLYRLLERRWEHERKLDIRRLERRHQLLKEILEANPDQIRAFTDALEKLPPLAENPRRTNPGGAVIPPVREVSTEELLLDVVGTVADSDPVDDGGGSDGGCHAGGGTDSK